MAELDRGIDNNEAEPTKAPAPTTSNSSTEKKTEFNKYLKKCQHKLPKEKEMAGLIAILILFSIITGLAVYLHLWVISWIFVMVMLTLFVALLGIYSICRPMGILINERNLMSLARLQLVLWTVIIGSAYFAIVLARIVGDVPDPFDISIDWRLWALLGISVTSLVGAPLIDSNKSAKEPENKDKVEQKVADTFKQPKEEVEDTRIGILYGNPDPCYARFTDMFEGNELVNTAYIDITKLQMFYFTLIGVMVYAWFLLDMFLTKEPALMEFPILTEGFIAILAISHAGYLGGKSITQTKTTD